MRKYIVSICLSMFLFASCSNWLDVEPKTTVEEEEVFSRELGFKESLTGIYIKMTSTDLYARNLSYGFLDILGQRYHKNDKLNYEDELWYTFPSTKTQEYTDKIWSEMYNVIANVNNLLYYCDKNKHVFTTEHYYEIIKGEALGLRAFYYFILVNTYGQPYNAKGIDVNTTPGVPLILESTVKDEFPKRESVGAVYGQIETDLLEAKSLLDKYGQDNYQYKVTPIFVDLLLSRMYLYMEKWDKVVEYASNVITKKPTLRRLSDYVTMEEDWFSGEITLTYDRDNGGVYNYDSPEVIWGYAQPGKYETYFLGTNPFMDPGSKPAFTVSESLIKAHEDGDLRIGLYYAQYIASFIPMITLPLVGEKCKDDKRSNSPRGMRVAEAYLNRAEANIRLFLESGNDELRKSALNDLNYLREFRFIDPYVEVDIQDGNDLLTFCLKERRCELSFEDHRWFDLRRLGMPEIRHKFTIVSGQTQEYVLKENSLRYVLPIAKEVMDKNPALVQNP